MKEPVEISVRRFFEHFEKAFELYKDVESIGPFTVAGMGGSAIAGIILSSIADVEVINCPKGAYKKPLKKPLVLVSYSGNTWETLSWASEASFALTSNGKLSTLGIPLAKLPGGLQPRAAFPYMITALAKLYSNNLLDKLKAMVEEAKRHKEEAEKAALAISSKLKEPIVSYATCGWEGVAYRLKTQLNENAKAMAFFSRLPEAFHNEIENPPASAVVVGKGFDEIKAFTQAHTYEPLNIIDGVYFADTLSIHYAKKKAVNMDDVPNIKKLKAMIKGKHG